MSFTVTSTKKRHNVFSTTSVMLSPSKYKRPVSGPDDVDSPEPSAKQTWAWTMSSEAIAPCSVLDALEMRENKVAGLDFFWLGRVPCRSVEVLGLVIGVQIFEKRIIYTIDDGSGVIECNHAQTPPRIVAEYEQKTTESTLKPKLPPLPKPVACIGNFIRVVGRLQRKFETRQIIVDSVERCSTPNDEISHRRRVQKLHKVSYDVDEPFIIPLVQPTSNPVASSSTVAAPETPSTVASSPCLPASSPIKESTRSSPHKMRHPSRLRTNDLTDNAFRINLKHYMDHINEVPNRQPFSTLHAFDPFTGGNPVTPTKQFKSNRADSGLRRDGASQSDVTPRASSSGRIQDFYSSSVLSINAVPITRGFTLSYLRRVPELNDMARRVVKAEAKRRAREAKKMAVEGGDKHARTQRLDLDSKKLALKMKSLFKWAIIQLVQEGSIIIWEGPQRPYSDAANLDASSLWSSNSSSNSNSTLGVNGSLFSTTGGTTQSRIEDGLEEDDLSEPGEEEAYVSLTPSILSEPIRGAIKAICDAATKARRPGQRSPIGATKESILSFLRRDDQWRRLGEWDVEATLEYLKLEKKVWNIGPGIWDLTL